MDDLDLRRPVMVRIAGGVSDEEQAQEADAMAAVLSWMLRFQAAAARA